MESTPSFSNFDDALENLKAYLTKGGDLAAPETQPDSRADYMMPMRQRIQEGRPAPAAPAPQSDAGDAILWGASAPVRWLLPYQQPKIGGDPRGMGLGDMVPGMAGEAIGASERQFRLAHPETAASQDEGLDSAASVPPGIGLGSGPAPLVGGLFSRGSGGMLSRLFGRDPVSTMTKSVMRGASMEEIAAARGETPAQLAQYLSQNREKLWNTMGSELPQNLWEKTMDWSSKTLRPPPQEQAPQKKPTLGYSLTHSLKSGWTISDFADRHNIEPVQLARYLIENMNTLKKSNDIAPMGDKTWARAAREAKNILTSVPLPQSGGLPEAARAAAPATPAPANMMPNMGGLGQAMPQMANPAAMPERTAPASPAGLSAMATPAAPKSTRYNINNITDAIGPLASKLQQSDARFTSDGVTSIPIDRLRTDLAKQFPGANPDMIDRAISRHFGRQWKNGQ